MPDRGNLTEPQYRIPLGRFAQGAWYTALNKPRNLGQDFRYLESALPVPPQSHGTERLKVEGPLVLVANHYERPGLWMGWSGMIIAREVYQTTGRRVRFIAISEWSDYRLAGIPIPAQLIRFVFERFFQTFGFIPMEPEGAGAYARSSGLRAAMKAVANGEVIGIFPEGNIGPTTAMIAAQSGSAAFVYRLATQGAKVIPVGLFEQKRRLHVTFGPLVDLDDLSSLPRTDRIEAADTRIMCSVALLLPVGLRGYYADRCSGPASPPDEARRVFE